LRPTSDERFWPRLRPLRQQWSSGWQTPYRTVASPPAQPCGQDGERCPVGTCRIGARSRSNNSKWDSNTNLNRPRLSSPGGRGGLVRADGNIHCIRMEGERNAPLQRQRGGDHDRLSLPSVLARIGRFQVTLDSQQRFRCHRTLCIQCRAQTSSARNDWLSVAATTSEKLISYLKQETAYLLLEAGLHSVARPTGADNQEKRCRIRYCLSTMKRGRGDFISCRRHKSATITGDEPNGMI